jgi:glycosyltransferase involved in cell wall biosynthesis
LNILLINSNLGTKQCVGGIETHSANLASYLADRHNLIVGCWTEGPLVMNAGGKTVPARRITVRNSGDLGAIMKMARISREKGIQVIIANSGREYWPAAIAGRIAGTRVVLVRHMSTPLKITTAWMINRMVDKVIAVSSNIRDTLTDSGVSPEKIEVIHNGIPLARFDPAAGDRGEARKELSLGDGDVVIGAVGSLHEGKGVYDLLECVKRLSDRYPPLKLLFIGDGPERQRLEERAAELSIRDRVIFTGVRRDVERMYAAMDIFVLASSSGEAFGLVLVEAMAMRKPVIGTTVGGIPEIIENEINGLLVPPKTASAIAEAVSRYIDDEAFARKMAEAGRRTVEQRFADEAMGDHVERMLRRICDGAKGPSAFHNNQV